MVSKVIFTNRSVKFISYADYVNAQYDIHVFVDSQRPCFHYHALYLIVAIAGHGMILYCDSTDTLSTGVCSNK